MKQKMNVSSDGFAIMPSDIKKKKWTNATETSFSRFFNNFVWMVMSIRKKININAS